MTVGLCLSLWQAPKLIDRALGLKDSAGGMFGLDPAALLGGACEQSTCGTEKSGTEDGGLVIFTPQGNDLSDADRERLMAQAERHRPKITVRTNTPEDAAQPTAPNGMPTGMPDLSNLDPAALKQLVDQLGNSTPK